MIIQVKQIVDFPLIETKRCLEKGQFTPFVPLLPSLKQKVVFWVAVIHPFNSPLPATQNGKTKSVLSF
jgi:hypothetical protein